MKQVCIAIARPFDWHIADTHFELIAEYGTHSKLIEYNDPSAGIQIKTFWNLHGHCVRDMRCLAVVDGTPPGLPEPQRLMVEDGQVRQIGTAPQEPMKRQEVCKQCKEKRA